MAKSVYPFTRMHLRNLSEEKKMLYSFYRYKYSFSNITKYSYCATLFTMMK